MSNQGNNSQSNSSNHVPFEDNQITDLERSEMGPVTRFFGWCSGANTNILQKYPTEFSKYFGAGTAILMTALFAAISSTYAISTIFKDPLTGEVNYTYPLVVGLVWGFFIFFLDRYLVSSIKKNISIWNQVLIASPRLALAILIGLTVARPLELKIFESEIMDHLKDGKATELKIIEMQGDSTIALEEDRHKNALKEISSGGALGPEQTRLGELEGLIEKGNSEVADALKAVQCECNGTCGTNKRGRGPACKKLEEEYQRVQQVFNSNRRRWESEINGINERVSGMKNDNQQLIEEEQERYRINIAKVSATNQARYEEKDTGFATSLLAQHTALTEMSSGENKEQGVPEMIFVVTILFVFIECAPILVKLMSKAGPYDQEVEDIEYQGRSDSRQRRFLTRQELKVNKDLINRMAIEQRAVLQKAIDKWSDEQMRELNKKQRAERKQSSHNTNKSKNSNQSMEQDAQAGNSDNEDGKGSNEQDEEGQNYNRRNNY